MVATDLDGTIVRRDGTMSERTVGVLRELDSRGMNIVFATGRPPRWIDPVVQATGLTGPVICSNGAQVFDTAKGSVIIEHLLDTTVARRVAADLQAAFPDAIFAVEIGLSGNNNPDGRFASFGLEPRFDPGWEPPPGATIAPLDELLGYPIVKLMARCPDEEPDRLLASARELVGRRASVTRSIGIALVEICRPGVDKGTTLAELASSLGIDAAEVIAFGDQSNDAPMLAWAGRSVAVANAHPDALAAASEITASCHEDGVAAVLEDLLSATAVR